MPSSRARERRGPRLGLLVDGLDDEFQRRLLNAAEHEAREHKLDFIAVSGGVLGLESRNPRGFIFDLVNERNVDALLIATHVIGHHSSLSELQAFVDRFRPLPRVSLGVELSDVATLLIDNEIGTYTAVRHLLDVHGATRIAFVTGPAASQEAEARYRGYCRALGEQGIVVDPRYVVDGDFTRESGVGAIQVLFEERGFDLGDVDAIVCADDVMALGALDELERRAVHVPREMALIGFDDIEFARYARVPLTTVRQPIIEQVRYAVRCLAAATRGESFQKRSVTFKTAFVRRRSCGCSMRRREVFPTWSSLGDRPDLFTAFEARKDLVLDDLTRAAHGALERGFVGWEERLLDAFLSQVREPQVGGFLDVIEDLCQGLMRIGDEVGAVQDVLVALRRHAMACAGDPDVRGRVDDLIQDALLLGSDLAAIAQSQRRVELIYRMGVLDGVTAALLAAPDLSALSETAANHLPRLGIRSAVIALFESGAASSERLDAALVFSEGSRATERPRYPRGEIAPEDHLNGRSVVAEALAFRGEQLGVALFEYGAPDSMLYAELGQVLSAAVKGAVLTRALEDARREVEELAITDPLTGLFNRRHLARRAREEFERAVRHRRVLSAIVVDLDGFKLVNDRFGHAAGDRVLCRFAERLRGGVRVVDTVARFGGDEFVILLPETSPRRAKQVARRILSGMTEASVDTEALVTASFGAASFDPERHHFDQDELLRRADRALLEAKRRGKKRVLHSEDIEPTDGAGGAGSS